MAILPLKQRPPLACVKTTLLTPFLSRLLFFHICPGTSAVTTSGARWPLFAPHSELTIVDGMQDAFSPKASGRANKVTEFHAGPARRAGPTAGDAAPPVTRQ